MNNNQWQKFPNTFANKYTRETYDKPLQFKSDSSSMPFSSCPPPPKPSSEQLASAAAEICKAMKIESCKTSSYNVQGEVDAFITSASLNINGSSAVGCDQVMAMANSYYQSQQNITCILRQTSTKNNLTVTGINSIVIKAGMDLTIDGGEGGFEVDQKLKINVVKMDQLSQEQKNEITKTVKTTTDDVVKVLQDSKSGFGATPQGSKYISDSLTKIDNTNFDQNVSQTLNEISTNQIGTNTLEIVAGRNVIIKGKSTKINQDIALDIIATSILNDQILNVFDSMSDITKKTDVDITQKAKNEGVPNLFEGKWVKYIMIAIVLVVLFGGIGYAASKQDWGKISENVIAYKTGGMSKLKSTSNN
jgi:hypothetical protein